MLPSLFGRASVPAPSVGALRHPWLLALAFGIAYLLLDRASYLYPMADFKVTPWNPQPSLAIAFLMVLGWRWLWAVLVSVVVAEMTIRDVASPVAAFLIALVLSLGYAAIAATLQGRFHVAVALRQRSDVLRLFAVVAGGSLLIGAAYVAAVALLGGTSRGMAEAWLRFWIGDTVGIVVSLPLILMMLDASRRAQVALLLRNREVVLQLGAILASLWIVFALPDAQRFNYFYVLFLPLVWIAARHGMAGTAPAMILLQVGVIIVMEASGISSLGVFELQALLLALAMTGYFVAVTVDERQRISDDLRRTLKLAAAGEMAAAITHELNQPLTALNNYARACRLILESDSPAAHANLPDTLDRISAEARRAGDVIRRLRDLFKGGVEGREPVDVGAVAVAMVDAFRGHAGRIHFRLDRPALPAVVLADRVQIELVLRNLLQNAVDALAGLPDGTISLRLRADDDELRVDVEDTGPGVPADRVLSVFEPFASDKINGMGVGLPMSRAIVESHGGRLVAEPGPGGRVHFTLPRLKG
ncbi:ATP-binding protein [Azoarcus sp. CIB]|uniref:ATP-binding protein n=1 Tax=Aromatoleum sp. (strain CIB) TaxID=198107 RepID=UPI00067A8DF8|nr:ATP-binding protein [Azoarcus sp. CIB]